MGKFDEGLYARYAMAILEAAFHAKTGEGIDVEAVGNSLGICPADSRQLAAFLREQEYATVTLVAVGTSWLQLTRKGWIALLDMQTPWWKRWMRDHPIWWHVVVPMAVAIATGFVMRLLGLP